MRISIYSTIQLFLEEPRHFQFPYINYFCVAFINGRQRPTASPQQSQTRLGRERDREMAEEVRNKQVILKHYVTGSPKESDMEIRSTSLKLKLPPGSNAVLIKNLYLSCDPYMRGCMSMAKPHGAYIHSFTPGSVR